MQFNWQSMKICIIRGTGLNSSHLQFIFYSFQFLSECTSTILLLLVSFRMHKHNSRCSPFSFSPNNAQAQLQVFFQFLSKCTSTTPGVLLSFSPNAQAQLQVFFQLLLFTPFFLSECTSTTPEVLSVLEVQVHVVFFLFLSQSAQAQLHVFFSYFILFIPCCKF